MSIMPERFNSTSAPTNIGNVGNSGPMVPMCEKHGWWPVPHLIYAGPTGSGSLCGVCAAEEIVAAWEAAHPGRNNSDVTT